MKAIKKLKRKLQRKHKCKRDGHRFFLDGGSCFYCGKTSADIIDPTDEECFNDIINNS